MIKKYNIRMTARAKAAKAEARARAAKLIKLKT